MKIALHLLSILLLATSCLSLSKNDENMSHELKYLALGDSYTIGESVQENERWPVQLVNALNKQGYYFSDPQIIATTGWTTDELIDGVAKTNTEASYDMVSLLIGVNNQYRNYPIDTFKVEFELLLSKAIEFADGNTNRVFVVSIPDYGVTPFGQTRKAAAIAEAIDLYNLESEKIALKYGIQYFNITDVSREALDDQSLTAEDKLHPSGKMYQKWVDIITPGVVALLAK